MKVKLNFKCKTDARLDRLKIALPLYYFVHKRAVSVHIIHLQKEFKLS